MKYMPSAVTTVAQLAIESLIRNIPWQLGGSWIRRQYYCRLFKAMGKGGRIDEGIVFYSPGGIECGSNVGWGRNSVIQGAGGLKMGNDILMGPSCFIWTINHDYTVGNMYHQRKYIAEPVVVEDNVWISANVKITPGVRVGTGSVIAMGSVVTDDVPAHCVVAGNPAKIVKKIDDHSALKKRETRSSD
jgi:maltose O-acetyltransferase